MNTQFADIFANLAAMTADAQQSSVPSVVDLNEFEIACVSGGEAITNVI